MAESTRILIADDHAMFRAGIRALLESEPLLEVVGEVSTGDDAVDQARILKPNVVLMDLSMPGSSGLEATRRIAALNLDTKILVLTAHAEEEYLVPVVDAGASGYLTKTSADTDLIEAVKVVARGQVYLPPKAATLLLKRYKQSEEADDPGLHSLSSREQEVLALTAGGFSSREIGKKLFISPKTVDTYRARITEKLGLTHRSELVRFALRVGLLSEL
ncbi:MAG: response regulator transcription factor [Gemmatimonadetes bacterium]|nr:response regulator transcription factor [Gemmatimonadota bacterium]